MEWSGEPGVGYRLLYQVFFSGQKKGEAPNSTSPPNEQHAIPLCEENA